MGRFRKSQSKPASKVKLSSGELKFITDHTSFTEDHIKEWHKGFMEDCPDGRMDREKMKQMFHSIMPKDDPNEANPGTSAEQFLDQLFRIFDKDGDGSIDFKEFMIATDMSSSGDPAEKLRWAFRMYDKDSSGEIDLDEMVEIFCLMYAVQGFSEEEATERAEKIFHTLDRNNDGNLEEDEFIKGCLADEELLDLLNAPGVK